MEQKKIIITGGPSTGKTSLIHALERLGYPCFHEVIRSMTDAAKKDGSLTDMATNPIATVSDPMAFNTKILNAREQHYIAAQKRPEPLIFFDRGMPDVIAYMDFFGQSYGNAFTKPMREHRYDRVFLLPIWEAIYVMDGERFEPIADAKAIHDHLYRTYTEFGYDVILVPKDSIANRTAFVLDTLHP
ncbi:AAA family ATPase [Maribacter sp. 2-571]|uniref:AAA family ATPase n=1 Tax=Maribacter sp. 2-571 TaxID=3417569 RepID=UPI003D33D842